MKNQLLITAAFVLATFGITAQTKNRKIGIETGAYLQQYNGNLGNSFFKFKETAFGGGSLNLGLYLNKSFDVNVGGSIGHFGYCQTEEDKKRVVSLEYRCPGCTDRLGMGELRSMMISGNTAIKYKFANGYLLKEDSKIAPYVYAGVGINYLSDVMKRNCVNVGNHFTINAGAGVKYNITERLNIGYNLGVGCFMTKKVYYTNAIAENNEVEKDGDDIKMEKRKDFFMQHALTLGFNF
jgi:opacity protein-like surface antigen